MATWASDDEFDALLAPDARASSPRFWTPVAVAERAAQLLSAEGAARVLDVGAGVGKFCLVGARAQPALQFHGIEHRPRLVAEARRVAADLALSNATFAEGDALAARLADYDALYFFNPFSEHLVPDGERLDHDVELSRERFVAAALRLDLALRLLPPGRLVVTYHGLAGPIPASFDPLHDEEVGTNHLRVWRRSTRSEARWVYLETDQGVFCADRKQLARILAGRAASEPG